MSRLLPAVALSLATGAVLTGLWQTTAVLLLMVQTDQRHDEQIRDLQLRAERERPPASAPRDDGADDVVRFVPVGRSPARGPDDAWVTVVAFVEYQCPYCARVQDTLDQLLADNPDVRLVVKHNTLPFHQQALPAAIAAECAHQQGSFWAVDAYLFAADRELKGRLADAPWASLDVDPAAMARCRDSSAARAVVLEEQALAKRLGVTGTPSFFVNGRRLVGARPLSAFQGAVDRARAEAVASGIPADRYYVDGVLAKATER